MNPRRDWDHFWFDPIGGTSLGLFRFFFGLSCIIGAVLLWPDRVLWFTDQGPITFAVAQMLNALGTPGPTPYSPLNAHTTELGISLFFIAFIVASLTLSLGFCTRTSAILVDLGLSALHNRNNQIINGSDLVFSVMAFYLILSPAGAVFSVDRLIRLARGKEPAEPRLIVPWAQRLMQIQVSIIYCAAVLSKVTGSLWINGMAVYYPVNYPELQRFPIPHLGVNDIWLIDLLTYGAIATEFALVFFIWHPRLRLYVITAGVLLHLGIEYSINVPMFAGIMIASYLTFITDEDWKKLKRSLKRRFAYAKLTVTTNGTYRPLALALLKRFDPVELIQYKVDPDWQDSGSLVRAEDVHGRTYLDRLVVREMASRIPVLWPLRLISWFPGGNKWAESLERSIVTKRPAPAEQADVTHEAMATNS